LILVVVLVIAAVAGWYIMGMVPAAFIDGTATLGTDNVVFTPSPRMTPNPIPAADWRYRILDENKITRVGWRSGVGPLRIGELTTMAAPGVVRGDYLRIQYRLKDFRDFKIRAE
jgi:hypothetical protein